MDNERTTSPIRKRVIVGAVAIGSVLGAAGIANAVTTPSQTDDSSSTTVQDDTGVPADESTETPEAEAAERAERGPDKVDETPLEGTVAEQVTAAALEAVPGGTIVRVETDAQGAAYEAHMTDADGNEVTVTFDENFAVVEIMERRGPGGGRHGGGHFGGGHDETPLEPGAVADQVTAAAEAAVPGGTVTEVEQQGDGFEAHVTDADGNEVEVHFDADLNVLENTPGR